MPPLEPPDLPAHRLSLARIAEAAACIDPVFLGSPQFVCEPLSDLLGCRLTVKVEVVNPIRSFKGRGADYYVKQAFARGEGGPLVCASAGNFGQAMAYACRDRGRALIVYAAEGANVLKLARIRALGAEVRLAGQDFDAAKAEARAFSASSGVRFVEDGQEAAFSEGAGTIAIELLARHDAFDVVAIPLGNGALLTGMARFIKAAAPRTGVVGVSSRGAPAMAESWRLGRGAEVVVHPSIDTVADGIGVRTPIAAAVDDMHGLVDDVLLVDDAHILEAMRLLHRHVGVLIEPAGAAGLAGILAEPERFRTLHVATVLCGGNVTPEQVQGWRIT